MKGIILAGGKGTRLYPITKIIDKNLLPVGRKPMILYNVLKLKQAEINDILVVTGKQSAGLYTELLGSGSEWNVNITLRIQEEAGGIAQALALAEDFIQPNEKFVVILGDNLFEDSLQDPIKQFMLQEKGAMVLLKEAAQDLQSYGVPIMKNNEIIFIEEKPNIPKSPYCVTGIYMYHADVFEVSKHWELSAHGEYEITDVNNAYAAEGTLTFGILEGWWTVAETYEALQKAAVQLSQSELNESYK
jgi:glucose-1-phosphate thymidylyltransferase